MEICKIKCYLSKTLKSGKHPIVLQVYRGTVRRIYLPLEATPKTFDNDLGRFRKNEDNYKEKNLILQKYLVKANRLVDEYLLSGKPFDFKSFKEQFTHGKRQVDVYELFQMIIKDNKAKDKVKNAAVYRCAMLSLQKFKPNNLKFIEMDYNFLKNYEKHLHERGVTGGGANNWQFTENYNYSSTKITKEYRY